MILRLEWRETICKPSASEGTNDKARWHHANEMMRIYEKLHYFKSSSLIRSDDKLRKIKISIQIVRSEAKPLKETISYRTVQSDEDVLKPSSILLRKQRANLPPTQARSSAMTQRSEHTCTVSHGLDRFYIANPNATDKTCRMTQKTIWRRIAVITPRSSCPKCSKATLPHSLARLSVMTIHNKNLGLVEAGPNELCTTITKATFGELGYRPTGPERL